jgi:hypothetical protein
LGGLYGSRDGGARVWAALGAAKSDADFATIFDAKIAVATVARVVGGMCVTFRCGFCVRNRFAVFLGAGAT